MATKHTKAPSVPQPLAARPVELWLVIPRTPLAANLAQARQLEHAMAQLRIELEASVTGGHGKTSWRHHPTEWLQTHPADQRSPQHGQD